MIRVKVQAKETKKGGKAYKTLYVVIPADYAEFLNIKEGDELWTTIKQVNVDGKQVQALVYYKSPERE